MSIKEISSELGLKDTSHWGLVNSDGGRVSEFIEYIIKKDNLDFSVSYSFAELIIASMNDAILEGNADCNVHGGFYRYIKPILSDSKYDPLVPYWLRIKSQIEFPMEKYMLEESGRTESETLE